MKLPGTRFRTNERRQLFLKCIVDLKVLGSNGMWMPQDVKRDWTG